MFSVGDKYRCKKSTFFDGNLMIEDTYYNVIEYSDGFIKIMINEIDVYFFTLLEGKNKPLLWFYDYFYTKKEDRIEKLKKLREDI